MGLDNGLVFKIKCPSLKIDTEYEICYFRKYWGLRNEIVQIFERNNEYKYSLSDNDILKIYNLLSHYSEIDNVREAELSTIWDNMIEVSHIRYAAANIKSIIDFIYNKISLYEFMVAVQLCEIKWGEVDHGGATEKIEDWFEQNEEPPIDLEYSFYFYDSY
jgi:hypothetical protein